MSQTVYLDAGTYQISFLAAQGRRSTRRITRKSRSWSTACNTARSSPRAPPSLLPVVDVYGRGRGAHHRVPGLEPRWEATTRPSSTRCRSPRPTPSATAASRHRPWTRGTTNLRSPVRPGSSPAGAASQQRQHLHLRQPHRPRRRAGCRHPGQRQHEPIGRPACRLVQHLVPGRPMCRERQGAEPADRGAGRRRPGRLDHSRGTSYSLYETRISRLRPQAATATPSSSSA